MAAMGAAAARTGARTGAGTRRSVWIVVAASVAFHLVLFAVVGFQAPGVHTPRFDESKPVDISLVRPPRPQPRPQPSRAASPPPAPSTPVSRPAPPQTSPPGPAQAQASAPTSPAPAEPAPDEGVRAALRQALGCQIAPGQHQTQEDKARCSHGFADAARTAPPVDGLDPALRATWDAQKAAEAARRDGAAQADLKAIQNARGGAGASRKNDINAGFSCGLAFGVNAKPGLSGLKCSMSYPKPPPPAPYPKP